MRFLRHDSTARGQLEDKCVGCLVMHLKFVLPAEGDNDGVRRPRPKGGMAWFLSIGGDQTTWSDWDGSRSPLVYLFQAADVAVCPTVWPVPSEQAVLIRHGAWAH